MNDYPVILEDMPTTIKSFVRNNPDGTKTIVINAKLNAESRLKRYIHEVNHIESGEADRDVDREQTADCIEMKAHGLTPDPAPIRLPVHRRKRRRRSRWSSVNKQVKFLQSINHDFFAAAEERYLDPR